jgi:guanidinobutyrase
VKKELFQPLSGNVMPRFGGPATFMRLPACSIADNLDAAFIGVPFDIGTSNRPGARLAPRQIRDESRMLRPYNMATRAAPFDSLRVADVGDVAINTFNLLKSVEIIEKHFDALLATGAIPLTMGGDHTIVLPILRSMRRKFGPVGLIHIDAHADSNDEMFGEKLRMGLVRVPWKKGCSKRSRATGCAARLCRDDPDWARSQGFRVVQAEELFKSPAPLMREVVAQVGGDRLRQRRYRRNRPGFCTGTGTVEIGGLHGAAGAGNHSRLSRTRRRRC